MTAPDQIAKTYSKTLAGGGRPHMSFVEHDPQSGPAPKALNNAGALLSQSGGPTAELLAQSNHSIVKLALRTTSRHLAYSVLSQAANSSGGLPTGLEAQVHEAVP